MSKQKFEVKNPVKIGTGIVKDGTVDLDPKDAEPLVKSGSLVPAGKDAVDSTADSEISLEVFAEAVAQLDGENKDHWTGNGLPDLKALDKAGLKLKAGERDTLWAQYQEANG